MVSLPRTDGAVSAAPLQQPPSVYDPAELKAYFSTRPTSVLQRQAEVASKLSSFVVALLADWRLGAWERNMPARASWLRSIFESLGPAYVKIAQALSTRVDLLPDPYLEEFAKLQDNVPPFATTQARALLEEQLGQSIDQVCHHVSRCQGLYIRLGYMSYSEPKEFRHDAMHMRDLASANRIRGERLLLYWERNDVWVDSWADQTCLCACKLERTRVGLKR